MSLFDEDSREKQKILDRAVDAMRERFGDESIMRASFLCRENKAEHTLDKFSPFRSAGGL